MTTLRRLREHLALTGSVVRSTSRSPALRRVQLAFLLFNIVEFGTWIVVLLYAYDATGPASVGLVVLIQLIPAALLAPFLASLADRFPRDRVLAVGYLAMAAAAAATGLAMASGASPLVVYAAATTLAVAFPVARPTQGALLPGLARTPEELCAANGLSGTVEGLGLMLGPLAAAAILAVSTPAAVFAAATVASVIAALLVARLPRPIVFARSAPPIGRSRTTDAPDEAVSLLDGLRMVGREPNTRLVVMILGLRMVVVGAMDVLFVLLALELFDAGDSAAGLLNAALGVGTIVGGAITFSLVGRQRLAPSLAAAVLVCGVALVVLGALALPWLAPPLIAIAGIGLAASDVVGRTILQRVSPDALLGRILGALEGIGLAGLAVGAVSVSILADVFGVRVTAVLVGLILPLAVALSWAGLARMDRDVLVPVRALGLLRRVVLFAPLPPPQQECVARGARWITVEPGVAIIREGDVGDAYYVLESGEMAVSRDGSLLRLAGDRAEGFGEIALLHDVRRTATVTATEPSVLLKLGREAFLEAVTGHEPARLAAERVAASRA